MNDTLNTTAVILNNIMRNTQTRTLSCFETRSPDGTAQHLVLRHREVQLHLLS